MLTASKLAKFFADRDKELLKFMQRHGLNDDYDDAPAPEPKPKPRPKHAPGTQEWFLELQKLTWLPGETHSEMLLRKTREDVAAGRAITSDSMGRQAEAERARQRLPRGPGQQRWRSNGFWSWLR